jgi:hypothetical protein
MQFRHRFFRKDFFDEVDERARFRADVLKTLIRESDPSSNLFSKPLVVFKFVARRAGDLNQREILLKFGPFFKQQFNGLNPLQEAFRKVCAVDP